MSPDDDGCCDARTFLSNRAGAGEGAQRTDTERIQLHRAPGPIMNGFGPTRKWGV